ncbi:TetR/AcrR family transcriptional regulator C-terminal domain-containing protein [Nonomuraea fuscirosea]|uniref:TetR/AcrR family transcriptional regulator C-terminal domain-containing protein n=1 Tax=Nonomuraea fuscirosea TaxID=1291556 RepID=UPI00341AD5BA
MPPAALKLWQRTGPSRTRRELAERLRRMAERGDLAIDDPARAAGHLMLLIREMIAAGVSAFLYGYAKRDPAGG